jgi:hypothetical protein
MMSDAMAEARSLLPAERSTAGCSAFAERARIGRPINGKTAVMRLSKASF